MNNFGYIIEVLVHDESGSARFMLWDKECYELIGKKAADAIKSNPKSFDYVPKEIEEALTDRVGLFKVQVREIDQSRTSVIYNVTKVTADEKILSIYNENYIQKKLLCPNEEIRDNGNMILDSRENRDETVEEEHEELQGKKSNTNEHWRKELEREGRNV
ncbi:hypothetical protein OROGR_028505 [Orobanche gracilis]